MKTKVNVYKITQSEHIIQWHSIMAQYMLVFSYNNWDLNIFLEVSLYISNLF